MKLDNRYFVILFIELVRSIHLRISKQIQKVLQVFCNVNTTFIYKYQLIICNEW